MNLEENVNYKLIAFSYCIRTRSNPSLNLMRSKLKILLIFVAYQLIGLYLFKDGYLLSRIELPNISNTDFKREPKFNRLVIVLIDALRYDFISPTESSNSFENKVTIIKEKLSNEPEHSLLFRGMSDPPTTTLQRLIALMTGSLPTLVDAGSNFASAALTEDNLLLKVQAVNPSQKMIAYGDDTWERLFPTMFDTFKFFPSFDVWDLDTVDNGVKKHLFPGLNLDYRVMIAHFLGVDHVGHRYGPGSNF